MISVFMDVEDPINPLADDAAREFGDLFTAAEVTGSFCVTGEKCRTLMARNRHDVIEALRPHASGLHTDTHSFHPTTMELLADCDVEEGLRRSTETEGRGLRAFVSAFGRGPAFWGGAGNTWSCEISMALGRLGIPAYSYALTEVPGVHVHRYEGSVAFPQHVAIGESAWRSSDPIDDALARIAAIESPWVGVFVGHPTRFRYQAFWDAPYAAGRTPPTPEFAEPTSDRDYEAGKSRLFDFLRRARERFEIVGMDEAIARTGEFRAVTPSERAYFDEATSRHLTAAKGWPNHRTDLNVERIVAKSVDPARRVEIAVEIR